MISILVKRELAYLHYFPREGHPGFSSVGNLKGMKSGETSFCFDGQMEGLEVENGALVPFSTALRAAHEFANSESLPKSVEWFEL